MLNSREGLQDDIARNLERNRDLARTKAKEAEAAQKQMLTSEITSENMESDAVASETIDKSLLEPFEKSLRPGLLCIRDHPLEQMLDSPHVCPVLPFEASSPLGGMPPIPAVTPPSEMILSPQYVPQVRQKKLFTVSKVEIQSLISPTAMTVLPSTTNIILSPTLADINFNTDESSDSDNSQFPILLTPEDEIKGLTSGENGRDEFQGVDNAILQNGEKFLHADENFVGTEYTAQAGPGKDLLCNNGEKSVKSLDSQTSSKTVQSDNNGGSSEAIDQSEVIDSTVTNQSQLGDSVVKDNLDNSEYMVLNQSQCSDSVSTDQSQLSDSVTSNQSQSSDSARANQLLYNDSVPKTQSQHSDNSCDNCENGHSAIPEITQACTDVNSVDVNVVSQENILNRNCNLDRNSHDSGIGSYDNEQREQWTHVKHPLVGATTEVDGERVCIGNPNFHTSMTLNGMTQELASALDSIDSEKCQTNTENPYGKHTAMFSKTNL